jgi:hypothetical protein
MSDSEVRVDVTQLEVECEEKHVVDTLDNDEHEHGIADFRLVY